MLGDQIVEIYSQAISEFDDRHLGTDQKCGQFCKCRLHALPLVLTFLNPYHESNEAPDRCRIRLPADQRHVRRMPLIHCLAIQTESVCR
jgi:hypothetical protein